MPVDYDGDEVEIRIDPKYIKEFLKVVEKDGKEVPVRFGITDAESPALLTTEDGSQYVVMPLSMEG